MPCSFLLVKFKTIINYLIDSVFYSIVICENRNLIDMIGCKLQCRLHLIYSSSVAQKILSKLL